MQTEGDFAAENLARKRAEAPIISNERFIQGMDDDTLVAFIRVKNRQYKAAMGEQKNVIAQQLFVAKSELAKRRGN